jgi:osmotically-inducible protein OsmY
MPRRTAQERVADADTADRVRATLLADPNIYARHVDVVVDRGVVRLEDMSGRMRTSKRLGVTRPRSPA